MYLQYQLWKITKRLAYRPTANTERIQIPFANINFFENVALVLSTGCLNETSDGNVDICIAAYIYALNIRLCCMQLSVVDILDGDDGILVIRCGGEWARSVRMNVLVDSDFG